MTQHMAFFTDQAVESMVRISLQSLAAFYRSGKSDREVTKP